MKNFNDRHTLLEQLAKAKAQELLVRKELERGDLSIVKKRDLEDELSDLMLVVDTLEDAARRATENMHDIVNNKKRMEKRAEQEITIVGQTLHQRKKQQFHTQIISAGHDDGPSYDVDRLRHDIVHFAENCVRILYRPGLNESHPDGGYGFMILSDAQKRLAKLYIEVLFIKRLPFRAKLLKTRQLGSTTFWLMIALFMMVTRPNYKAMLIIDKGLHHKEKKDVFIEWLKYINENFSHVFAGTEIIRKDDHVIKLANKSMITFESAEGRNPGTSEQLHFLIESEKPKWPARVVKVVQRSVMPSIPMAPETVHIDESTAEGAGAFKVGYQRAASAPPGSSIVLPIFLPWFISPQYSIEPPEDFSFIDNDPELFDYDSESDTYLTESQYAERYTLTDAQVYWRRVMIKDTFDGDRDGFDQEYPTTPEHAWRQVESPFFNGRMISRLKASYGDVEYKRGDIVDAGGYCDVLRPTIHTALTPEFVPLRKGSLFVREEPILGERYFLGGDLAEGKAIENADGKNDPDWTILAVKNASGRTVAVHISRVRPEEVWYPAVLLAKWYNNAVVNIERNNHGIAALGPFFLTGYSNCVIMNGNGPVRDRMWLYVSSASRPKMLSSYRRSISADADRVFNFKGEGGCDPYTQIANFVKNEKTGKAEAAYGFHDDIVLAEAHAHYAIEWALGDKAASDFLVNEEVVEGPVVLYEDELVEIGATLEDCGVILDEPLQYTRTSSYFEVGSLM